MFWIYTMILITPQLLPPYLNAITSLIGSFPKGFGEVSQRFGRVPQRVWEGLPKGLGNHTFKQRSFTR